MKGGRTYQLLIRAALTLPAESDPKYRVRSKRIFSRGALLSETMAPYSSKLVGVMLRIR